jgi:hypothetical protein
VCQLQIPLQAFTPRRAALLRQALPNLGCLHSATILEIFDFCDGYDMIACQLKLNW